MKNKQKTVDEYIQILIDKNGYISTELDLANTSFIIPENHPVLYREDILEDEYKYEQTLVENDETVEIYKNLSILFEALNCTLHKEDYFQRIIKYYQIKIDNNRYEDNHNLAGLYLELAKWSGHALSTVRGHGECLNVFKIEPSFYGADELYTKDILQFFNQALILYKNSEKTKETEIADVYWQRGKFISERKENSDYSKTALQYYKRALRIYKKIIPKDDASIARIYLDIARILYEDKGEVEAIKYCKNALNILQDNNEVKAEAYSLLGLFESDICKSADYYKKVLDYEHNYRDLVIAYSEAKRSSFFACRYEDAKHYGEKLIELCKKICSFHHTIYSRTTLLEAYLDMAKVYDVGYHDYEKSKYYYTQFVELVKIIYKQSDVYAICFGCYIYMADLAFKYKDYDEAIRIYTILIRIARTKPYVKANAEMIYKFYRHKGYAYGYLGNMSSARRNLKRAVDYFKQIKKEDIVMSSILYEELSGIYALIGQKKEAYEAMAKSTGYESISKESGE